MIRTGTSAPDEVVESVVDTLLAVIQEMHTAMTPVLCRLEITMAQVKTMLTVATTGQATVGSIARAMGTGQPAASTTVDRLVHLGWLDRTEDPLDRRRTLVRLTPAGEEQVEAVWRLRRELLREWVLRLEGNEVNQLAEGVTALREAAKSLASEREENEGMHENPRRGGA